MNSICRKYLSEVKSSFPIMGSNEKKYLANLAKTIEDYCETEKVSSFDHICNEFGQPQSIITSYLETVDTSLLIKKIQLSKWIEQGILFFLLFTLIGVSLFGVTTYKTHKMFQQKQIIFEEETIGSAVKETSDMQTKITTIDYGDFHEVIISDVPTENAD